MRLIDADALLHGLPDDLPYKGSVRRVLMQAPEVDAVPVVRCENCMYYDMGVCLKIYSDGNVHPEAWQPRKPEDFCSYGDRKDGDNAT